MVFGTTILGSNPSAPAKFYKMLIKKKIIEKIKKAFFPFYKSEEVRELFKILNKDQSKDKKVAMFVGGCVRKYITNSEIDDIDIATIFTPIELKKKFNKSKFKFLETGVDHGSVTLILNNIKFELTTLRKDDKTDGRHAEVSFIDNWTQDSERRDFTINAIYLDEKGKIFDPQLGKVDLENKVIKFIGDPEKRIQEDFLRIIRFIRFSLQYNYQKFEKSTINAIKINLAGIQNISRERVLSELIKILKLNNLEIINDNIDLRTIFLMIFPELKYIERLSKINKFINKKDLNPDILLAILVIDNNKNHEYFLHKYSISNVLKNRLTFLGERYFEFKENKKFFKENLIHNIYVLGKQNLHDLNIINFFLNKKKSFEDYLDCKNKINSIQAPKFPYDGNYLLNKGVPKGKKVGEVLKILEEEWLNNNFTIDEIEADKIIKKFNN